MKNYIVSEEELNKLKYISKGSNFPILDLKNWLNYFLKSKQPVELVAEGEVNDLCHDFGIWATKQWTPNAKFKVYISKVESENKNV